MLSNKKRFDEAKRQLLMRIIFECETERDIKTATSFERLVQQNCIRFVSIEVNPDNETFAKTGPIKCEGGFSVRFRLIEPSQYRNDWFCTSIFLVANQIPLDQCVNAM